MHNSKHTLPIAHCQSNFGNYTCHSYLVNHTLPIKHVNHRTSFWSGYDHSNSTSLETAFEIADHSLPYLPAFTTVIWRLAFSTELWCLVFSTELWRLAFSTEFWCLAFSTELWQHRAFSLSL